MAAGKLDRGLIGRRGWRLLHYLSFAVFFLAMVHGVSRGSDTTSAWAPQFYAFIGGSILFLTIYRVLTHRKNRPTRRARPA